MDYRSTKAYANEIHLMIKTAYDHFTKDNFRDSLGLTKVLIREAIKPIEYCDDSNGSLGDAISITIDLLGEMVNSNAVPFPVKDQINEFLAEKLKNSLYFDFGNFGYEMTSAFFKAAKLTANHEGFIAFTDKKIKDQRYTEYNRDFFTTEKIKFLEVIGNKTAAENLIIKNIDISGLRAAEVEKRIESKDYASAKNLLYEGIAVDEQKKHHDTVDKWQKALYTVAVLEKDLLTMRSLAKTLAFDGRFDPEYYNRWKSTYTVNEWSEIIENHIETKTNAVTETHNKETHRYYKLPLHIKLLDNLSDIYIQEKYIDRILEFIKIGYNLDLLIRYHAVLVPKHATELLDLYPTALENQCEGASTRSDYKGLANVMKKIIKTIPESKDIIAQVAQKLIMKYPRRPAMIDEFKKV